MPDGGVNAFSGPQNSVNLVGLISAAASGKPVPDGGVNAFSGPQNSVNLVGLISAEPSGKH
ncbi:hypothetical protein, partial [Citrobacter farmeri]